MTDHTSKEFEHSLEQARGMLAMMAARVERQLRDAMETLRTGDPVLVAQILQHEAQINRLERAIDEFGSQVIARRQPAARDLRLLVALLGATTDFERMGDEAKKIALYVRTIFPAGRAVLARVVELEPMAELVLDMLRQATRSLEALDPGAAAVLVQRDVEVNRMFRAVLARLAAMMVGDPRAISSSLDVLFVAKSLERIGDHAKNVGEHVVYATSGKDVRHASAQEIERVLRE